MTDLAHWDKSRWLRDMSSGDELIMHNKGVRHNFVFPCTRHSFLWSKMSHNQILQVFASAHL